MRRLLAVTLILVAACGGPRLEVEGGTPGDLADLARTTFQDFVSAFPARQGCIGEVVVAGSWELGDRARYDPDSGLIEVRIPATAPQLTVSLVHELAHHLEHACPEQKEVRPRFLAALGVDAAEPWSDPESYQSSPSELWAEAVVRYVTGAADSRRPLAVSEAAVEVVEMWGRLRHAPSAP